MIIANHTFISQEIEVNDVLPILGAVKNDGNALHTARLA